MNLTQRTMRITLASVFSILLATYLGLENVMSAGIIALLSVFDTRLETVKTGFQRIASTVLAFIIATAVFLIFGFSVFSFGLYLAIYVPLAYAFDVDAGISPCSVLVTHFVVAESVAWTWQLNGMALMIIGVGFALLFNMWMPSFDQKLDHDIVEIEKQMSLVLFLFEKRLSEGTGSLKRIKRELDDLCDLVLEFEQLALVEYENSQFSKSVKDYYVKYAQMRKQQYEILERILSLFPKIEPKTEERHILASIFGESAEQLDEKNPGTELLNRIDELNQIFKKSALPKSREEFESRAILYYIFTDFENFLLLKRDFYQEYEATSNEN